MIMLGEKPEERQLEEVLKQEQDTMQRFPNWFSYQLHCN